MKTFFMKIFLVVASTVCMFEGLVLVAVGLGRLTPDKLVKIYNKLLAVPHSLSTILGVGFFFVVLGFILLAVASRTKPVPKMIEVEKNGRLLSIPQATVKDFIRQILEQNRYMSDITVEFEPRGKDKELDIFIVASFNGVPSVHEEINRIEGVLAKEMENVFDWKGYSFKFQLRGIGIDPKKRYFGSEGPVPEEKKVSGRPNTAAEEETKEENEEEALEPAARESAEPEDSGATLEEDETAEENGVEDVEETSSEEIAPVPKNRTKKIKTKSKNKTREKAPARQPGRDSGILSRLLWGK
ncbi:MAG: hypothetical protein HQL28_06940 [Candidatus Omnitrophica bacterium]|nr:hypothetical protein [Candidatus Omnitrophota bacterium]